MRASFNPGTCPATTHLDGDCDEDEHMPMLVQRGLGRHGGAGGADPGRHGQQFRRLGQRLSGSGNLVSFATLSGGLAVRDVTTGTTTTILPSNTSQNLQPAISQDGQRVAFTASGNLLGQNADGNAELYVYDMASNSLRQLTNTTGGNARGASISSDGSRIAFSTFSDPLGQNGDGSEEISYYDMNDGLLTQATQTSGGQLFNIEAELSADGRTLAYTSNSRAAGGNGS